MTLEEREKLPPVPLWSEQIADAVVMFAEGKGMAGRVMIWREGGPWRIVPTDAPH